MNIPARSSANPSATSVASNTARYDAFFRRATHDISHGDVGSGGRRGSRGSDSRPTGANALLPASPVTAAPSRPRKSRRGDTCIEPPEVLGLSREWVGAQLKVQDLAGRALAALHVERRPRAHGPPEPPPLPASGGIVDPAVHPLGVEPHRVGDAQHDPF